MDERILVAPDHSAVPDPVPAAAKDGVPMSKARVWVLQHIRCEPPGLFSGPLRDRGFVLETVELDEGGCLPDLREVGLVLAMGGPMGAYDEAGYPWLAAEKRWIAAAVRAGTPYFGVSSARSYWPRASARRCVPGIHPRSVSCQSR